MNELAPLLLSAVSLFFPDWGAAWQQRPLTPAELAPPYALTASAEQVAKAQEGLRLADATVRQRLILGLRRAAQNPQAHATLVAHLAVEQDPATLATLLQQLQLVDPTIIPAAAVQPLLTHPDLAVAAAAVQLYGRLPAAEPAALQPLLAAGTPLPVWHAAWDSVRQRPQLAAPEQLLAAQNQADLTVRAAALGAIVQTAPTPAVHAWIGRACAPTADPLLRLAVARHLAGLPADPAGEFGTVLAADPLVGIRLAAAASLGGRPAAPARQALLSMLADAEPAVRRAALHALRPHTPAIAELPQVTARLADDDATVRAAAEATLAAWQGCVGLEPALLQTLASDHAAARRHAVNVLRAIAARDHRQAIAERLATEELPENLAAGVLALGQLANPDEFGALILGLAPHRSPPVRAAVAEAAGRLRLSGAEPVLITLAADPAAEVRVAAFTAMGRHGAAQFGDPLQKCLENISMTGGSSPAERAAAAWSASRLRPLSLPLLKRLVVHCTKPVIPAPMGPPMFDSTEVIGDALFSLALAARDHAEAKPLFTYVTAFIASARQASPAAAVVASLTVTPELEELLRQATALHRNQPFQPVAKPLTEVLLPYEAIPVRKPL